MPGQRASRCHGTDGGAAQGIHNPQLSAGVQYMLFHGRGIINTLIYCALAISTALIIIPDPEMWTLMVWLYQLQVRSHQAVVYAAVVIAAIPTLLVFVFCQSIIIIRGIIVPVEK